VMAGVPAATAGGRAIASQLSVVEGWNAAIVAAAALILAACAILAALVPACRAAAIDPLDALRAD
jgi:ABC-type antimicrobial peptide transport system permease subunit